MKSCGIIDPTYNRTFYAWVPIWGPTLALLYLTRSRAAQKEDNTSQITPRSTDWSGSGNIGRLSEAIAAGESPPKSGGSVGSGNGMGITPDRHSDGASIPPIEARPNGNRVRGGSATSSTLYSTSPSVSITPSPSTIRPGAIYRPPDYPSVLFKPTHESDDECDEDGLVSERTTSVSLHGTVFDELMSEGHTPSGSCAEGTGYYQVEENDADEEMGTDTREADRTGSGYDDNGNWMYPPSEEADSSLDDPDEAPSVSIFASSLTLSQSHNMLTRISSVGTGHSGSFNDDSGVNATLVSSAKAGRRGSDQRRNRRPSNK